ncbi:metallophosphoesterase [Oligoflexia bacterium]|nr:metallophosphoesterase [Oligoflexia bacterium]
MPSAPAPIPGANTLVVIPDTQVYLKEYPEIFHAQMRWISDSTKKYGIKYVLHVGDVVTDNSEKEWGLARAALDQISGKVPVAIAFGNHDLGSGGQAQSRTSLFVPSVNQNLKSALNSYHLFATPKRSWLVIALELCPRDEVLAWARRIIEGHSDRSVIVLTHAYLNEAAQPYRGSANPNGFYKICQAHDSNDGQALWLKLISRYRNIAMTVSGHFLPPAQTLASRGDEGNIVHQLLVNFQDRKRGGDGFLRLLQFLPNGQTIQVNDYSPVLDQTKIHPSSSFSFDLFAPPKT